MQKKEIFEVVRNKITLFVNMEKEQININSRLIDELSIDSFSAVCLMDILSEEFKFDVKAEDVYCFVTVSDIVDYIAERIDV